MAKVLLYLWIVSLLSLPRIFVFVSSCVVYLSELNHACNSVRFMKQIHCIEFPSPPAGQSGLERLPFQSVEHYMNSPVDFPNQGICRFRKYFPQCNGKYYNLTN